MNFRPNLTYFVNHALGVIALDNIMKNITWILLRRCTRVLILGMVVLGLAGCVSGGNRPVQLLSSDDPVYAPLAKSQGVQGYVIIEYTVSIDGQVLNPVVVESEPLGVFDTSAMISIASWVYKPMIKNGEAQQAEKIRSRLEYRLGESERYKGL